MMFPGHSQSMSKCFSVCLRRLCSHVRGLIVSLPRHQQDLAEASGSSQEPFLGLQPCPARGKVTCWSGESTGFETRQTRGVNPSL